MSNEQDNTALIAIVIALIAFFVTVAQLLQQLFGTAEGYRRCQESVIGRYAKKTRRHWRWREFRFETKFTTPIITTYPLQPVMIVTTSPTVSIEGPRRDVFNLTDTHQSKKETLVDESPHEGQTGDLVNWLSLLRNLHQVQGRVISALGPNTMMMHIPMAYCLMTTPAIKFRERSWDFMPPDIVRPYASSTVGEMVVLAHRLGMEWIELRPGEGIMRAEGHGQSIISTTVRGFGILLQYSCDEGLAKKAEAGAIKRLTIPTEEADKLGFGIIPGYSPLSVPDFTFGDYSEVDGVIQAMLALDLSKTVIDMYRNYMKRSGRVFGFSSDLLGMASPFMPLPRSSIIKIRKPLRDCHDGPLRSFEGFTVFGLRIEGCLTQPGLPGFGSEHIKEISRRYENMRRKYSFWVHEKGPDMSEDPKNTHFMDFLDDLNSHWDWTESYFNGRHFTTTEHPERLWYMDLVAAHISSAVYYPDLWEANIKTKNRLLSGVYHRRLVEAMHIYIDGIPQVVEFMKDRGFDNEGIVIDAYWTLLFRAMCWHRATWIMPDPKRGFGRDGIPSNLYESRTPVYLA